MKTMIKKYIEGFRYDRKHKLMIREHYRSKMTKEGKKNLKSLLKLRKLKTETEFGSESYRYLVLTTGIDIVKGETEWRYVSRVTGINSVDFDFLFSCCWDVNPDTRTLEQTLARIKVFIKNGYVPPRYFKDEGRHFKASYQRVY